VLKEVFRDKMGPKGGLSVTVDDRSNTIIVTGTTDQVLDFAKLLQTIDVPAPPPAMPPPAQEVFLFRFNQADPKLVEDGLHLILPTKEVGRFLVDREQHLVIIYSRMEVINLVKNLLARLDETPGPALPMNLDWRVRVIWLRNAPAEDKLAKPLPKDFGELLDDLGKLGLDRPAVASQLMARITPQMPFEIAGGGPPSWKWAVNGRIQHVSNQLALDLTVTATDNDSTTKPPVFLRTHVNLNSPKAMIVGAAATGPLMSAFVVEVSITPSPKAAPKKG
jgi:hypothetical protein